MNENFDPRALRPVPSGRGTALAPAGGQELWQPNPGYPASELDFGQAESGNLARDALRYFSILMRHRWVVLGIALAFICLGALYTYLSTPVYQASTTLQIDREPAKVVDVSDVQAEVGNEAAFYATQYEVLRSRSLAEAVVSGFSVEELQDFTRYNVVSPWSKLRGGIMRLARPSDQALADGEVDVAALQKRAAYKVMRDLSVQPVGTSRLVRLSFKHPNPAWAERVANAVGKTFVAVTLDRRYEASSFARTFLEERLQELKLKLEDSEKQALAYAQQQKIVNIDERRTLVSANLEALNTQLVETSRQRLQAEQLLKQAEASGGLSLPQVLNDESVRKMRDRRAELSSEYQNKLSFFKPGYPEMQKLQAQIAEIDNQVNGTVELVKASLKAELESAQSQETSLKEQLEAQKVEVLELAARGIQYRILQREVDTNRELYDGLLQRFKEVGVAGAVGNNNVSVIDTAERPGAPFTPSLSKNLTLAFGFGLFCGGLAAFGLEFLDDTFKVPEEVETGLGLPVLGVIPIADSPEAHSEAMQDPRSAPSEAYRSLRTALQFSTADGVPKTLLVTSSRPNEGKSTTALSLAKNFADLGVKTLLIDGDLRNPSLHKLMERESTVGLTNVLVSGDFPVGAFQPCGEHLTFLPAGPLPPNPAELLASPKMPSFLTVAAQKFELVIIDGPPVMGIADAPLLASVSAGTLLVVEAGETRRAITKAALKRLYFARAQVVGAVLNKFDARAVGHTYGYGYGYGDHDYYGYGQKPAPQITHNAA